MPNNPPNLASGPVQAGYGAYGGVPGVPNPFGTQNSAISGNMGNLSSLYGLTNSLNTSAAQQAVLPFQMNLPNYNAMTSASSGNILSKLHGQVPPDVANQIAQMAAERGASTGSIGSPNSNSALLRALGLTSLDLTNQGETQLTGAMARTPQGQQFNPQQFLITPGQLQEAQFGANTFGAAPNPTMAAHEALKNAQRGVNAGTAFWHSNPGSSSSFGRGDLLGFPGANMSGSQDFSGGMVGHATNPIDPTAAQTNWNAWAQGLPTGPGARHPFQEGDFENMGFQDDQSQQMFSDL